jgi:ubiquinone/menaquinone biosynthesis C-methylase UbiE
METGYRNMSYGTYTSRALATYAGGMQVYRGMVRNLAAHSTNALHLGCGRDLNRMRELVGASTRLVGIDPDAAAVRDYPGEAHVGDAGNMPFADASFDLVFSEYVLEHLETPEQVFKEVARVLGAGGTFISVAPNFWSYKSLAAWATPHAIHRQAVRFLRRDTQRQAEDVYPTVFRANTRNALSRLAAASGLTIEALVMVDNGPTWFQRIPVLFELGRTYHALLKFDALAGLRCNIVSVLRKPAERTAIPSPRGHV